MEIGTIEKILRDTDYERPVTSAGEKRCAEYLRELCSSLTPKTGLSCFPVPFSETIEAEVRIDGRKVDCVPYFCSEDAQVKAPLYFLHGFDEVSLENCAGHIVIADGYPYLDTYEDILKAGALALICYSGDALRNNKTIEERVHVLSPLGNGKKLPAVTIGAADALRVFRQRGGEVELTLRTKQYMGESRNVLAEFPGEDDGFILCTAHYDTIARSHGAYDNMSGCLALLELASRLSEAGPLKHGVKILFTGGEEIGGKGIAAWLDENSADMGKCLLNVNVDMLGGCGAFQAVCTAGEKTEAFVRAWAKERHIAMDVSNDVYSGDSSYVSYRGTPSVSFTRFTVYMKNIAPFHSPDDTMEILSLPVLADDMDAVAGFIQKLACGAEFPYGEEISAELQEKIEIDLGLKKKDTKK